MGGRSANPLERAEAAVTTDAIKALRDRFPGSFVRKIGMGGYSRSGAADVYCLLSPCGRSVWIEMKTVSEFGTPTMGLAPHQVSFGQQILEAGGWWGIACSVDGVIEIAQQVIADNGGYRALALQQLTNSYEQHELARSIAAKKRKKKRPITADQMQKALLHQRRTRRKYPLTQADWDSLRRPTVEG